MLTTADLRKIERDIESGIIAPNRTLTEPFKSIMLRGVRAEIESRSTLGGTQFAPFRHYR